MAVTQLTCPSLTLLVLDLLSGCRRATATFPQQCRITHQNIIFTFYCCLKHLQMNKLRIVRSCQTSGFFVGFGLSENQDCLHSSLAFFSVLNYSRAEDLPVGLPADWIPGQRGALSFPTAFQRGDIIGISCYWRENFDLRWEGQEACCQSPPQVSQPCSTEVGVGAGPPVFRWCWAGQRQQAGVVQQEPCWGTASTSWQPQRRNSSGGRCSSRLASQLQSNVHT